jgi:hypothetical protein
MRRVANTDANQKQIVSDLRRCGYSVISLHAIGNGVPDLYVAESTPNGRSWLIEIKTEKGRFEQSQIEFMERWRGPKIHVCRSTEEALAVLQSDRCVRVNMTEEELMQTFKVKKNG